MITNNKYSKLFDHVLLAACVRSVFLIVFAIGGNAAYAGEIEIEEVIVTAQKREQRLIDVPLSVASLDNKELDSRGIDDLKDLAYAVPDLTVFPSSPGGNVIFMRGVGNITGSGTSLTGLYIDDAAVSIFPTLDIDLRNNDLERVEVLRGPQGTLYGQSAMGGTVRFITKKPELDHFGISGKGSISSIEDGELNQRITGVVNVPIVKDNFGLRVVADYENKGGWVDYPLIGQSDINDSDIMNVQIKGLWSPNNALELKGMAVIHRVETGPGNASHDVDEDRNLTVRVFPTNLDPSEIDYDFYSMTATYDFGSARLLSVSSYINSDRVINQSYQFFGLDFFSTERWDIDAFTQELRLNSTGVSPLVWTAGLYYRDWDRKRDTVLNLSAGGFLFSPINFLTQGDRRSWAAFGDIEYAIMDNLEIGGGVRYFEEDVEDKNVLTAITQEGTFDSVDWRLYLSYGIAEDIKIYASAATGFRGGGLNDDPSFPPYDPDEVISYEVGSKMSLLDGRLSAEFALFYSEFQKLQTFRTLLSSTGTLGFALDNTGDAEIKGIDWSLKWNPVDALTLAFSGNVLNAEIKELGGIQIKVIGDPVDFTPEYTYTLSASYNFNWASLLPGSLRIDYNELGEMTNIDRVNGIFGRSGTLNFINAKLNAEWGDWIIEVFVKNLLDDNDDMTPFDEGALGYAIRPQPRTIGVSIAMNFM